MITQFIKKVEEEGLQVDSIIVTKGNKRYEHYFTDNEENAIRSISKVVSCLGASKAIEMGLYELESSVLQFFDEEKIINRSNLPFLREMKIKHLLDLTIGQDKGLMFSKDVKLLPIDTDYLYYILNYDICHKPGDSFVYNNAATYLLCAITQKLTGQYFRDWICEKLFTPIGIELGNWEKTSQGICLGASGLSLTNENMHKIALLLLNEGLYDGKQVINSNWIKQMKTPHYFTANLPEYVHKQNRCINKMAYGYGLWICGDGSAMYPKTHYFCDGTDGQFLIVSPMDKMAITVLSHQKDMNPLYPIIESLF